MHGHVAQQQPHETANINPPRRRVLIDHP